MYSLCVCVCVFQVAELEAQLGPPAASQTGREELNRSLEELEALLSAKDQARHQFTPCTAHCPNPFTILKGTSVWRASQEYTSNTLPVIHWICLFLRI